MTEENKGLSRRTVVKGAAWSVPVIAAAVAMPLASASNINQALDVTVTGSCTGQYDIADLQTLLAGVSLAGLPIGFGASQLVDVVKAALAALPVPILDGAKRGFNISVAGDVLPQGATFVLSTSPGTLINADLTLLSSLFNTQAQAAFIANVNGSTVSLTTTRPIDPGESFPFELVEGLLDVDALTTTTLTYAPALDTTAAGEGADAGSFTTLVGTPVNIGSLNLAGVLDSVLGTALALLVGPLLGTLLLPQLTTLSLRVQVCQ
ncbi:hypothetical protein [Microbacterium sp. W4I4]|uniref:hypothetical protein n=1 Tax=Microbacterium sp. W4I4 TaxID=3042295 RepID=UPI0027D826EE|nr:hypothetical protein [Microbacterium sp. W4I4]